MVVVMVVVVVREAVMVVVYGEMLVMSVMLLVGMAGRRFGFNRTRSGD